MSTEVPLCSGSDMVVRLDQGRQLTLPNFELRIGETLAVLGKNGAGKSTLCRVIAGLTKLDGGRLDRTATFRTLSVGFLAQSGGLYPDLTVAENIHLYRSFYGRTGQIDPRFFPLLFELGLEESLEKPVHTLSGGYARLAALAAVLLTGARALILDEPFSGLDEVRRRAAVSAIEATRPAIAFLIVTAHEASEIEFASRSLVIGGGR